MWRYEDCDIIHKYSIKWTFCLVPTSFVLLKSIVEELINYELPIFQQNNQTLYIVDSSYKGIYMIVFLDFYNRLGFDSIAIDQEKLD